MARANCARCGSEVDSSALLFSDVGRICGECELALDDEEGRHNARWTLAVGGPLMAFSGLTLVVAGLIPTIGLFTAGAGVVFALVGLGLGVRAFLESGNATEEMRTLLVLCGALAVPSGLLVLGGGLGMLVLQVLALATGGVGP